MLKQNPHHLWVILPGSLLQKGAIVGDPSPADQLNWQRGQQLLEIFTWAPTPTRPTDPRDSAQFKLVWDGVSHELLADVGKLH